MHARVKALELKRVSILLDRAQIIRLKHVAVDQGGSTSAFVREALAKALREREGSEGRKPTTPSGAELASLK